MTELEPLERAISPQFFLGFECACPLYGGKFEKHHMLPLLCELIGEKPLAEVSCGYRDDGLYFAVDFLKKGLTKDDTIELFIDTRPSSSQKTTTRFCHHFRFYPEPTEGIQAEEVTRFRTEDRHPLCSSDLLQIEKKEGTKGKAHIVLFIPREALVGYDPQESRTFGFTYILTRNKEEKQHFSMSSLYSDIEFRPYQWALMQCEE